MGWHTYLAMAAAAVRGEPIEPRSAMQRNAARYGVVPSPESAGTGVLA